MKRKNLKLRLNRSKYLVNIYEHQNLNAKEVDYILLIIRHNKNYHNI